MPYMTEENALRTIETMLRTIPGVESAYVFQNEALQSIGARVRCTELNGCHVLAQCGMASNVTVQISGSNSRLSCETNEPTGLPCDILFSDDSVELPTEIQRFGFFLAKTLYSLGLVDDSLLDSLERDWRVHFSRDPR
ncbi:MAG: hypothetical protein MUC83_06965 [Pirellula sp.]|nr:hypothetical protein [Pirellula sp.]